MTTELERLLATAEPADLGPGPREGVLDEASIRQAVGRLFPPGQGTSGAFLALMLLWHDHHEPAHELAQSIETADGSYVHAILHRREPDYSNSKYWFRRVGPHPAYREQGRRVAELLKARGASDLGDTLVPGGRWDPMAFVDACEAAASRCRDPAALLREIQRIEFEVLAAHLAGVMLK